MRRTNLKLVESTVHYREEKALWTEDGASGSHSIHNLLSVPGASRPEFAQYFIERYSIVGDVILDPFCGAGTVAVESLLRGRVPYASDANPLALLATKAKLLSADITEITLFLQMINLRRPVNANLFRQGFSAHFDLNTYRELVNLRAALHQHDDNRVGRVVQAMTASLLHGHTASYLSVYTSPQASLSPDAQELLNIKRRQTPDYRAVVPRVLRKSAMVLRDGVTTSMRKTAAKAMTAVCDARDLRYLASDSVQLVLTSPPIPDGSNVLEDTWLKNWFIGVPCQNLSDRLLSTSDTSAASAEQWMDFMGAALLEMARVVSAGGRVVLNIAENAFSRKFNLEQRLVQLIDEAFDRYFDTECTLINLGKDLSKTDRAAGSRANERSITNRVLVLRRR